MKQKKKIVIVLLGPPGSGKGTQATHIAEYLKIPHISTGDLFRENIQQQTTLGITVQDIIKAGKLVSDDIVLAMVKERIQKSDCLKGFLLDGVPRTLYQAKSLDELLSETSTFLSIKIDVPDSVLVDRICGRRVCSTCKAVYHIQYAAPKKDNICDHCQSQLTHRPDDTKEVISERLAAYHNQIAPIEEWFVKKNQIKTVNGVDSVENIRKKIENMLIEYKQ